MVEKLRIGLIGCGEIAHRVSQGIVAHSNAEISAVFDLNSEYKKTYAENFNAISAESVDDLLTKDIQAVAIATPPFTHHELAIKSARAGKHVFVEKPMAISVAASDKMIEEFKKSGTKLMVGHVLRYYEPMQTILQWNKENKFGKLQHISVWHIGGGSYDNRPVWKSKRSLSGGYLFEIGIHEMDFIRCLSGKPVKVSASLQKILPSPHEIEDMIAVHTEFDTGVVGTYLGGVGFEKGDYGFVIRFEKAILRSRQATKPGALEIDALPGHEVKTEDIPFSKLPPFNVELGGWIDSIINNTAVPISGEDARETVVLVESAYKSAETSEIIKL